MIEYIYIVKCPNCEDEHFHFFDDAKTCAMGYISDKPIITQVEVERNDFGECTDSHDLGTVWSWEDMMKDVPEDTDCSVFTKGDLNNFTEYDPDSDSEFDSLDNSVDFKISEISNNCCNHVNTRTEELAESSVNRFVIVGEKEDYSRQFYNTESGEWVTKSDDATLFDDRNSAIEVWYDLDKSDFYNTRVMIELVPVTEGVSNNSDNFRKPIPTDMTIEALVEENEDPEFDNLDNSVDCKTEEPILDEWVTTSGQETTKQYVIKVSNNSDGYNYEGNGGRSLVRIDSDALSIFSSLADAEASLASYKKGSKAKIVELADELRRKSTLEEARVDPIDSVEATDRKLISLVQDKIKGPLADRVGSSGFYSGNGQRFMVIPVSTNSDAYDFDSYKQELRHVFPTTDIYSVMDDYEMVIDVTPFYRDIRKPVPEGMTIESLVEEMEENEDTVECKWCNELFDKSECRYEVDLGYLCSRCEAAIESRGEPLTFREGPLDETYERDPLDHHDPDYNEDEAADYLADQNDRAKDANFDIELSSLQESFNPHESVEFEYDDLEITVIQGDMDPETGTYDTCKRTVSYTYEQDKGDVAVDIWENFITEEDVVDVPGGLEALEDETLWNKFLETHFDTLFDKYYKNLLEFYRKYATSSCQDNYDSGYGNFDDFYSEDIDKNIIGHSMLEELEESEDYRNRLTLCPECGTNSFGPETCICMNCGFNTLK